MNRFIDQYSNILLNDKSVSVPYFINVIYVHKMFYRCQTRSIDTARLMYNKVGTGIVIFNRLCLCTSKVLLNNS